MQAKYWVGKWLCEQCSKDTVANINIGFREKRKCHRCHAIHQYCYEVIDAPAEVNISNCSECGHPSPIHAAYCRRSEAAALRTQIEELEMQVQALKEDFARVKILIRANLNGDIDISTMRMRVYKYAIKHGSGIHFSMDEEGALCSSNENEENTSTNDKN